MDGLIGGKYKLKLSKEEKKKIGFKYDYILNEHIYKFPVYFYNNKPLIFCKLGINEEDNIVWFNVYNTNDVLYAPYYNRNNNNLIVPKIDKIIVTELKKIGAKKVK